MGAKLGSTRTEGELMGGSACLRYCVTRAARCCREAQLAQLLAVALAVASACEQRSPEPNSCVECAEEVAETMGTEVTVSCCISSEVETLGR